jgi:hypothetical protein
MLYITCLSPYNYLNNQWIFMELGVNTSLQDPPYSNLLIFYHQNDNMVNMLTYEVGITLTI